MDLEGGERKYKMQKNVLLVNSYLNKGKTPGSDISIPERQKSPTSVLTSLTITPHAKMLAQEERNYYTQRNLFRTHSNIQQFS